MRKSGTVIVRVVVAAALVAVLASARTGVAQTPCCDLTGRVASDRFVVEAITERRFTHADLWTALAPYVDRGGVRVATVGHSVQGRAIRAVTFGSGPVRVLLWSQMHGDESTATMALADVIRFFAEAAADPLRSLIEERLTITMIPMLNPDGAERFQRHNAAGVDVNRDARRLATPEARVLKMVRDSVEPSFGFNLHDQGARTTVGSDGLQAAIALLAPAADSARSYGPVRSRARQLAAVLAAALQQVIPGRVAKYDDAFNPRAFGDLIQQWGTSTVLIESGALPDDPQKQALRWLNRALLLSALEAIASERYADADPQVYEQLPVNHRVASDVLLVGGRVVLPDGRSLPLDLSLTYGDPVAQRGLVLGEVGDLEDSAAMDTVDVRGLYLHVTTPSTIDPHSWWLVRGEPIAIIVRRGADARSEIVRRVPEP